MIPTWAIVSTHEEEMKTALQLHLKQRLGLTPRMLQSIRLLQLSTLELKAELQQALESNIMLEQQADDDGRPGDESTVEAAENEAVDALQDTDMTHEQLFEELPIDVAWEDFYSDHQPLLGEARTIFPIESTWTENETLFAYLDKQLDLLDLDRRERLIASCLVDALDEKGYLSEPLDELCKAMNTEGQLGAARLEEFEKALRVVQDLEPAGIGARGLKECLLLQLRQRKSSETPAGRAATGRESNAAAARRCRPGLPRRRSP